MAYIKVDHSKFSAAAGAVDDYVGKMKNNMNRTTREVDVLEAGWQGKDYKQFNQQWDRVTNKDSTYQEMVKSLEAYSKFLRYAAEEYKNAQAKAVGRAKRLPKY